MVYSPGNYPRSAQQQPENARVRSLYAAVAVLGLAAYGVSFGPVGGVETLGWSVRFAALAGLVAAFGLLPRAGLVPLVTAVLAAMGFLDALWSAVAAADPGWAMTVIAVLNALQTAAAMAAVLVGEKNGAGSPAASYEAYVDYYNDAVRNYYNQQAGAAPERVQRGGYGQAYGDAQASAQAPRAQRPSQYADYAELDYTATRGAATSEHDSAGQVAGRTSGLPNVGQAPTHADQHRRDTGEAQPPAPGY